MSHELKNQTIYQRSIFTIDNRLYNICADVDLVSWRLRMGLLQPKVNVLSLLRAQISEDRSKD